MELINGYPQDLLYKVLFARMSEFTASAIENRVRALEKRLSTIVDPVLVPLGENCGPATKLREAHLTSVGSGFFDNLVCPTQSIIEILRNEFRDMMQLRNLSVSTWEGHDSVFDSKYGIYFHHYFYLASHEKSYLVDGRRRRKIEERDIPLFLAAVKSQFEYLAMKFLTVMRSSIPKFVIIRAVDGSPLKRATTTILLDALAQAGARNVRLLVIFSNEPADFDSIDVEIHRFIPETSDRWGETSAWRTLLTNTTWS